MIQPMQIDRRGAAMVVRHLLDYLANRGLSLIDAAAGIGREERDVAAIVEALQGRKITLHDDDLASVKTQSLLTLLNNWIEEHNRKADSEIPAQYVQTEVARRMIQVARLVHRTGKIGVATGPAGVGKSFVADHLVYELPGSVVARVNDGCRTPRAFIRAVGEAFRVAGERRQSSPTLSAIIKRLRGTNRLMIVDQAHELSDRSFRVLMSLNDEARIPILLIGTVDIRARVSPDVDPEYGQMARRIIARTELLPESFRAGKGSRKKQWLKLDELRRILSGVKLKLSDDALRMLHEIANFGIGFLGRAQNLWIVAGMLADQAGARQITRNHVLQAEAIEMGAEAEQRESASTQQAATA